MYLSFCPHCGETLEHHQVVGQMLTCRYCGKDVGVVAPPKPPTVEREEDALAQQGKAARCPLCTQLVELKGDRRFVPHFVPGPPRKMCPNSGKAWVAPAPPVPAAQLDVIRIVACKAGAGPTIEELTLTSAHASDRVRLQIEALRDILGVQFRMRDYPLGRPELAVWSNVRVCAIARKHEQGGYRTLDDAEIRAVVADLQREAAVFFA